MPAPAEQGGVDELATIVAVPFAQGEGQALGEMLDSPGHALVVQIHQGLQFRPAGRHVDRDERRTVAARSGLPTMQNEVALQGPGRDPGPLAPRAQGHLGAQRGQGGREAPRLPRAAPTQRLEQPVQRGRARAGQGRPHRRRQDESVVRGQGREQRGQNRTQQLARQLIAGEPRPLEDRGQLGRGVLRGAAGGPAPRAGRSSQPSDGRLAVTPGRAAVLVEQSSALPLIRLLIAAAHHRRVFSPRWLGHGAPFPVRRSVTPVLRQPLPFR